MLNECEFLNRVNERRAVVAIIGLGNTGLPVAQGCTARFSGIVIGRCLPRHRTTEFLKFLRIIDREVPQGLRIHMICDNYGTHKHADVKKWLAKHPRFHLLFIPTSSSWTT